MYESLNWDENLLKWRAVEEKLFIIKGLSNNN